MSRVLHVAQPADGGVAGVVVQLVADQVGAGWDVVVACPPTGPLAADAARAGARVLAWPARRGVGRSVVSEVLRLRHLIGQENPDLVHLHSAKAGLAGRLAVRGRRRTIFQPHAWSFDAVTGPMRWASLAWEWFALRWTARVACVSEHERRRVPRWRGDTDVSLVPNGIDLARFPACDEADRTDARTVLGLADAPTVVCVGRLCRQKGQDVLVAAWPWVLDAVPSARLVLVGDGPDRAALTAAALGVAAETGIHFVGNVDDPRPWYAAADVVAMPSRWEGMALVQLEAMASARCLVATPVGAAGTDLTDLAPRWARSDRAPMIPGQTAAGCFATVPVGDVEALARALIVRLQQPALAQAEASAARARVCRDHDVARATQRMRWAYLDTMRRPRPTGWPWSRGVRVRLGAAR